MLRGTTLFGLKQALSPPAATIHPSSSGLPVALLTVGLRNGLLWLLPFHPSAQERTSAGLLRARLSVHGPASLAVSLRLLFSVTAFGK